MAESNINNFQEKINNLQKIYNKNFNTLFLFFKIEIEKNISVILK